MLCSAKRTESDRKGVPIHRDMRETGETAAKMSQNERESGILTVG